MYRTRREEQIDKQRIEAQAKKLEEIEKKEEEGMKAPPTVFGLYTVFDRIKMGRLFGNAEARKMVKTEVKDLWTYN